MATKYCEGCGAAFDDSSKFCTSCGRANSAQVVPPQAPPPQAPPPQAPRPQQPQYAPPQQQYAQQPNYYQRPPLDAPMTVGQYIGTFILSGLPMVGFILLLVWAFSSDTNINKKNFARALLILGVIVGVLYAIFAIVFATVFVDLFKQFGSSFRYY